MDETRFDALVKTLTAAAPARRAVLRLLAGGALAALLAPSWRPAKAADGCLDLGERCSPRTLGCCQGRCLGHRCRRTGGRRQCGTICCPAGQRCADPVSQTCEATPEGTFPAGAESCTAIFSCNANPACYCSTTTAGATRCGHGHPDSFCGQCTNDAQCVAAHGAGAFCIRDTGPLCGCLNGEGFCGVPCPS